MVGCHGRPSFANCPLRRLACSEYACGTELLQHMKSCLSPSSQRWEIMEDVFSHHLPFHCLEPPGGRLDLSVIGQCKNIDLKRASNQLPLLLRLHGCKSCRHECVLGTVDDRSDMTADLMRNRKGKSLRGSYIAAYVSRYSAGWSRGYLNHANFRE